MHRILSTLNQTATMRRASLAVAAIALAASFSSCKNETEALPETGKDYYPVAVGNYWTYAVTDSSWSRADIGIPSVVTVSRYQFKETVAGVSTDAAGQPAYRLVRSKMGPTTTTFRDDSVFVLTANDQFVALNRNNTKTLEVIFPVREGRSWNLNAFNNNFNDTITAETRQYSHIGQPYTTAATGGFAAIGYPATLTTTNTGQAAEISLIRLMTYQQVFAKGVGPVFRNRRYFLPFTYTDRNGLQIYPANSYSSGFSRRETLIDHRVQ